MDNCDIQAVRGVDKRNALEHIAGEGDQEELDLTLVGNGYQFWINRSATERFVGFVDPDAVLDTDIIQVFNTVTGAKVLVEALASTGSDVALDNADADVVLMVAYLAAGSQTIRQRFRSVTVEDSTFLLNREVTTALEGLAIDYRNAAASLVRLQADVQNVPSWVDFTQPPTTVSAFPDRIDLVNNDEDSDGSPGDGFDNNAIWYARDDDLGLPQGFYWATSSTQPPWFQRLPTEGALSFIKRDTMPLRLAFDGTKFVLRFVDWTSRNAGDSTTNPGPTFIGLKLNDMEFHQGRFYFTAGERVVSSRVGDLFNLWIDSSAVNIVTDADPIDRGIQGRRISNGLFLESFRESLIIITDGNRQLELRANGPITPGTVQLYDSTNVFAVGYVAPVIRGSDLYFASERDFSMVLWEYNYDTEQITNVATNLTERVQGYIPAEAHTMATSDSHDQIFMLTLADPDAIYVNKQLFSGAQRVLNSWYRWVFPGVDEVMGMFVFDDFLFVTVKRTGTDDVQRVFLEKMPLGQAEDDATGSPAQTLGYSVRLDRKLEIQGTFDVGDDETTFTLPFEDETIDRIVLAGTWDTEFVKAAGTVITEFVSITAGTDATVIIVAGDHEFNADAVQAPVLVGINYEAEVELSQMFVRDQNNQIVHGVTQLMRCKIRHRDTGGYKVKFTPEGRSELTKEFVVPLIGSTPIDGDQLDAFGEFQIRIMAHSENLVIKLVNDTPFPTAWVDMEFDAEFIPQSYSPVR